MHHFIIQTRECNSGEYFDDGSCHICERGHYQPEAGQTSCLRCPSGTISNRGARKISDCYAVCPPGFFFDHISHFCQPCSFRGYQPSSGSDKCLSCPPGTVPLYFNSTAIDHCLENCPSGFQHSPNGQKCVSCPMGFFKSASHSVCQLCPAGHTTLTVGSISIAECNITTCYPGFFLNTTTLQCESCDYGMYSDEFDSRQCKSCPPGKTTYGKGSKAITSCQYTNQCKYGLHKCHWLAACMDLPDDDHQPRYSCKCKPGYIGNGNTCSDICVGLCQNGSTCLKTGKGLVKCVCPSGYTGRRCEKKIATEKLKHSRNFLL